MGDLISFYFVGGCRGGATWVEGRQGVWGDRGQGGAAEYRCHYG